ncbi:hypothetical protein ACPZ19_34150 [Amycolatopsis lurida]
MRETGNPCPFRRVARILEFEIPRPGNGKEVAAVQTHFVLELLVTWLTAFGA